MKKYNGENFMTNTIHCVFSNRVIKITKIPLGLQAVLLAVLSFSIPLIFGHIPGAAAQIVTGTIINALLIYSTISLNIMLAVPVVFMPVFGVLVGGALFGANTDLVQLLITWIWLGNASLVLLTGILSNIIKSFAAKFVIAPIAAALKATIVYAGAMTVISEGLIPEPTITLVKTAMGPMQFITALLGGSTVFGLASLLKKNNLSK